VPWATGWAAPSRATARPLHRGARPRSGSEGRRRVRGRA
jgi:hypothetical protein